MDRTIDSHTTRDRGLLGIAVVLHASSVCLLRQAPSLDPPGTPVKVTEPYQMPGEIKPVLMDILGVDAVGVWARKNMFGYLKENLHVDQIRRNL